MHQLKHTHFHVKMANKILYPSSMQTVCMMKNGFCQMHTQQCSFTQVAKCTALSKLTGDNTKILESTLECFKTCFIIEEACLMVHKDCAMKDRSKLAWEWRKKDSP